MSRWNEKLSVAGLAMTLASLTASVLWEFAWKRNEEAAEEQRRPQQSWQGSPYQSQHSEGFEAQIRALEDMSKQRDLLNRPEVIKPPDFKLNPGDDLVWPADPLGPDASPTPALLSIDRRVRPSGS
jgi:hypothetical protein